jgi:hypothetical protein
LAKCTGITRDGERCRGIAIEGSDHCYAHDPDRAEERRRNAHKGGKRGGRGRTGADGGGRGRPVAELGALRAENADIRERLLKGELSPGVAAVAVQSINTDIRAVGAALKAREQEELVARLEELEELETRKEGRRWRA